jgi:hypothetical protein
MHAIRSAIREDDSDACAICLPRKEMDLFSCLAFHLLIYFYVDVRRKH